MITRSFQAALSEPWLAVNRHLTVSTLRWRLRKRQSQAQYDPSSGSMLYVAASALPYHTSGYTTRTHEVIRALMSAGADVHAMTRPGYPWDRKDRQSNAQAEETCVGDVRYQHSSRPLNNRPALQYVLQAAASVAQVAARHRVAVIHAASNHVNALPALLAARQLGIPFQYEMRGLWELTRVSRTPAYENGQAYKQGLRLESLVAGHADRLFVISEQLGKYAHEKWGVPAERMSLLPNCVDAGRFRNTDASEAEPWTIGYAGTLIGYEGLDTLIEATGILVRAKVPVKVTLIGDGEARPHLEALVRQLGLDKQVHFAGKVPPDSVQDRLRRCALICIPRKPFQVCRIVPPIKLVEAMAMGKPVVIPDLPVFRDEMGGSPAGWFFKAGDAADLARVLSAALQDREGLAATGARARAYATTHRSWHEFVIKALPSTSNGRLYGR
ncbi:MULTISPECIES: glycosyltransferase family 4 protein [Achromobacter]|uniref:glycosyltransferase family 4 protein n=1 Tax=Achromobacter TaxID=222 RepID=UPI0025C57084|nr:MULTISPECIES: glycosyltransferase family 4 protein [Achromobacter]